MNGHGVLFVCSCIALQNEIILMYAPTRTRLRLAKLRLNRVVDAPWRATRGATSGTQPPSPLGELICLGT